MNVWPGNCMINYVSKIKAYQKLNRVHTNTKNKNKTIKM